MPKKFVKRVSPEKKIKCFKDISAKYQKVYQQRYAKIRQHMNKLIKKGTEKSAFYIFDAQSAEERIELWREYLPRVEIFYAVKTNPNDKIIEKCIQNNTGFDVASGSEMRKVMAHGGQAENCIYASPIKKVVDLQLAKEFGIKKMTFDCEEELHKIYQYFPDAECVMRIATEVTTALYNLSEKFGASMEEVPELLATVKKLGLKLKGVAFHTGSGGVTFISYEMSLKNVRKIFDMVLDMGMEPLDLVDIGGGFTMVAMEREKNFDFVAPLISQTINKIFPESNIRFIAEPGRYISESCVYHASTIIGTKQMKSGHRHYYIDSGIFQAYGLRPYGEDAFIDPVDSKIEGRKQAPTTQWGQTCDSCDWVIKDKLHPEFTTGEWIVSKDFGAYNMELGNNFNGYDTPKIIYF